MAFSGTQNRKLLEHARLSGREAEELLGRMRHEDVVLSRILNVSLKEIVANLHGFARYGRGRSTDADIDALGQEGIRLLNLAHAIVGADQTMIGKEFALVKSLFADAVRSLRGF